jgi:purine catabolism regulator
VVGGRSLGQLVLGAEGQGVLRPLYGRQAAEFCGIELLEQRARQETEERIGMDLVEQLVGDADDETVSARLSRLSYDLSPGRNHVVVAFGDPEERALSEGPSEGRAARRLGDVARDLKWRAERDGAIVFAAPYRGLLLAFCSLPPGLPERGLREWLRDVCAGGLCESLTVGVSRLGTGVAALRTGISQAYSAWDLGQHMADLASPYYYEQMGLYRLLAELRGRDELVRFYEESLGELVRYDDGHGTELVLTLQHFFEQNANASQAARALYVHRNTLNYRLQRIAEITGLDLDDAEARLALQLALKIHHLS